MSSKKKCCMWSGTRACVCGSVAREAKRKQAAAWGDEHKREALRAILRHCDRFAATAPLQEAGRVEIGPRHLETEQAFRVTLCTFGMAPKDRDCEVRRVRALAEGRLVRSEAWNLRVPGGSWYGPYETRQAAKNAAAIMVLGQSKAPRVVRIARIRRAVP